MSDKNSEVRSPIDADLRRRVLVEAGHRCAIPTCRHIEVDIHHIIPWATCKKHEYPNLIALCPNCHQRADAEKIDRKSLRLYKLNLRFIHDKYSQLEMDILFELYKLPPTGAILWLPAMHVLLKRAYEANILKSVRPTSNMNAQIGGMQMSPDHLVITPEGRALVEDLGLHEL